MVTPIKVLPYSFSALVKLNQISQSELSALKSDCEICGLEWLKLILGICNLHTSVELTEHAIYVLPLSSFTLAYNTFKNYMYFQLSWKKVSVVT